MSQERTNQQSSTAGIPKGLYVIIAIGVVIIITLMVSIFFLLERKHTVEPEEIVPDNRATIITPDNVEEVIAQAKEPVVAAIYYCSMNTEWHFKDSLSPSYDAYVANSESNSYTVYFDLLLSDTNELVYSSPYMEVGAQLDELTLSKQLEAGEYSAIATYHLVDEQHETLSTVSVTVTLYVES